MAKRYLYHKWSNVWHPSHERIRDLPNKLIICAHLERTKLYELFAIPDELFCDTIEFMERFIILVVELLNA